MENIWSAVGAGKARRASRLFGRDGRCLLVAIDLQSVAGEGPTLDVAEQVAEGGPDGMLVTWQIARRYPDAWTAHNAGDWASLPSSRVPRSGGAWCSSSLT